MSSTSIYVLDVGPVRAATEEPGLGWAGHRDGTRIPAGDDASLEELATDVAADLRDGGCVALGFEAPGWVPVPDDPHRLLRARTVADTGPGGQVSAWCGRTAVWSTARLLALTPWVLIRVAALANLGRATVATLATERWAPQDAPLLVFEAYVAGTAKPEGPGEVVDNPHALDALTAVEAFTRALPASPMGSDELVTQPATDADGMPFSLLGTALLHAGLSNDPACLRTPPLLLRPSRPASPPGAS